VTSPSTDAQEKGMERTRCFGCRPSRFDQHRASMRSAVLADPAVLSQTET
jgi:hypothetical protein